MFFLFKWVWRFLSSHDALWEKVVKAIHEEKTLIGCSLHTGSSFVWIDILKVTSQLYEKGIDLFQFCKKRLVMLLLLYFGRMLGMTILLLSLNYLEFIIWS